MESRMVENLIKSMEHDSVKETEIKEEINHVESRMVTSMRSKIEELEAEKKSVSFFEENKAVLTSPASLFFEQLGEVPRRIPVSFLFSLHNVEESRQLYVFDFIGIRDTQGIYPYGFDPEQYHEFIISVDRCLNQIGLSTGMKMNREQRLALDSLVREENKDKILPEMVSFETFYNIVRGMVLSPVPEAVKSYLAVKHKDTFKELAKEVACRCANVRLSNERIKEYLEEAMTNRGLTFSQLRKFSWESFENERKKQLREAAMKRLKK